MKMRCSLLVALVLALVMGIKSQFVFYPSFARIHSAIIGLPGLRTPYDGVYAPESGSHETEATFGDTEGRGNVYGQNVEAPGERNGDDLLGSVGGELNLNAIPNPFVGFRKETYPQRTKTIVVPPVCVACKCLMGYKSCADAGGKQWVSGECSKDPKLTGVMIGDECAFTAPTSLSACDSTCVRTCPAKVAATAPAFSDCTPIDAVGKKQCTTPCENLARGTIVKCNSAYPEVISNIPSPCYSHHHHRYRRDSNSSLPTVGVNSEAPEIQSSHETALDRSGRVIKLNFPINPRVNVNRVTNFVRGHVTATYVAADGVCLPEDLASAPVCP